METISFQRLARSFTTDNNKEYYIIYQGKMYGYTAKRPSDETRFEPITFLARKRRGRYTRVASLSNKKEWQRLRCDKNKVDCFQNFQNERKKVEPYAAKADPLPLNNNPFNLFIYILLFLLVSYSLPPPLTKKISR